MKALLRIVLSLAALAAPAFAQTTAQLKQELRNKETAAKKDPDALFEAGKWANEKALTADAKRIFQAVLKIKADHEGANLALGNVLVEGKWLAAKEAEALRKKAQAAEYAAKGYIEVSGVWVEKDKVDDAKKGVFHHDGERVTKEEMLAFAAGKVRHPETGEFIDPQFLEKAQNKYFPVGSEGRWVDEKEADTYHSDAKRPWVVRSRNCLIVSTLPFAKLLELKQNADLGYTMAQPLFGAIEPPPAKRPVLLVAADRNEFSDMGNALGDEYSSFGAFLIAPDRTVRIVMGGEVREVRAAVVNNDKDWGTRYMRHAAAIAYVDSIATEAGATLPMWLVHAAGSYVSRFATDEDAAWFGQQHMQKGGVRNLKGFFASFAINAEMESKDIDYNIFQAGLLVAFAAKGGDAEVTGAMEGVTAALKDPKKGAVEKAVARLQTVLIAAEPKIAAFLQQLIAKKPA